ncbi:MAG: SIS domain-containing protein [Actinomycetota bacterium]
MPETIKKQVPVLIEKYLRDLNEALATLPKLETAKVIEEIIDAYRREKQIFILGNGGSASAASHFACDLGKGTLKRVYDEKEKRFRVASLTDNVALISALANDLSYDDIFVQQLRNHVQREDLVIAISGSGNSPNVIKAIEYAKRCGAKTIGFLGFGTGGELAKIVDDAIIIQSSNYGPIEDLHLVLSHLITFCIAELKDDFDNRNP